MTRGIATDPEGRGYPVVLVGGAWVDAKFYAVAPDRALRNPSPARNPVRVIQALGQSR